MRLIPLLLLFGCAALPQYGQVHYRDIVCSPVGTVNVHLRPGAFQSCEQARGMVAAALKVNPLKWTWTVIFSAAESAGWDFSYNSAGDSLGRQGSIHYYAGMTYTGNRVIALSGNSSDVLEHEFGHAYDTEHGLPNKRDHRSLF